MNEKPQVLVSGKWKRYPSYKQSGVEWLGEVPEGWDIRKLKYISTVRLSGVNKKTEDGEKPVRLCNYVDVYYKDYITPDLAFMGATASPSEIKNFTLQKGDVLITKDSEEWSDIAVPAFVRFNLPGVLCGYHLAHIRPKEKIMDGEYLFRSFHAYGISDQFKVAANGITRYGIGKSRIDSSLFLVPSVPEQTAIATFLDRETVRIGALIKKKERLIALLEEKRAALSSHAVTKGLDPDAKMKDSGVEWIGEVPVGWKVTRLKHISPKISVGLVINPSTYVDPEGCIPMLLGSDIKEFAILSDNLRKITPESNSLLNKTQVLTDDLVTVRVGYPGSTAVIPPEFNGCNCASMMIIRKSPKFNSNWLSYAMNSNVGKAQIEIVQYGAAQKQFNISHAVEFRFPVPPLETQIKISEYLSNCKAQIDLTTKKVVNSIQYFQEYSSALISAAVTGKIDVRQEAT